MDRIALITNLVTMAAADGSFTQRELDLIMGRCKQWDIAEADLSAAIQSVLDNQGNLETNIPETTEACEELIGELVRMMGADGELADAEKELFAVAAAKMNITGERLDAIIDETLKAG